MTPLAHLRRPQHQVLNESGTRNTAHTLVSVHSRQGVSHCGPGGKAPGKKLGCILQLLRLPRLPLQLRHATLSEHTTKSAVPVRCVRCKHVVRAESTAGCHKAQQQLRQPISATNQSTLLWPKQGFVGCLKSAAAQRTAVRIWDWASEPADDRAVACDGGPVAAVTARLSSGGSCGRPDRWRAQRCMMTSVTTLDRSSAARAMRCCATAVQLHVSAWSSPGVGLAPVAPAATGVCACRVPTRPIEADLTKWRLPCSARLLRVVSLAAGMHCLRRVVWVTMITLPNRTMKRRRRWSSPMRTT